MSEDAPHYGPMDEQRARELLDRWIRADELLGGDDFGRPLSDQESQVFWRGDRIAFIEGGFTADELEAIAWWMRNKAPSGVRTAPQHEWGVGKPAMQAAAIDALNGIVTAR